MIISKFSTDDGITIFRLSGKLIASTLDGVKTGLDAALAEEKARVVLNFKLVNIIDSVAVGLLISRFKTAKKKKGAMLFTDLQPALMRLLALADLDKWLDIHESEEEALAALRAEAKS
ncbi:MAG: STAS domain-containing protein [Nitrospinae bacterium]|nr:STAS domain-containing protein [Nitrospinota bacterium]